jgi:putative membrane protein
MKRLKLNDLPLVTFFILLLGVSCNAGYNNDSGDSNNTDDSVEMNGIDSAQNLNTTKFSSQTKQQNAQYLMKVYRSGLYEISASKIMIQHSSNKEVKNLADFLVNAHQQLNQKIEDLAAKKNISLPGSLTAEQQQLLAILKKGQDEDFNENYLRQMVNDHKEAVTILNQAQQSNEPAIIKWADSTLPKIEDHLDRITTVQNHVDSLQMKTGQQ